MDLKQNLDPQIPHRGHKVKLKDLSKNLDYEFYSINKAAAFISETAGTCDVGTLRSHLKNKTIYKKRWIVEKI